MPLFLVLGLLWMGSSMGVPQNKIEDRLASSLESRGSANVFVSFKESTSITLASLINNTYSTRSERVATVTSALQSLAEVSQKSAVKVLRALGFSSFQVFWITNQIFLRGANRKVVDALAVVDNVLKITEDSKVFLHPLISVETTDFNASAVWGIVNIGAPTAWNLPGGNQGEGVIVGSIDSGVYMHPDLKNKFVGPNGWKDCMDTDFPTPMDDNGHGTFTTGVMVADRGIGVAPKAKWMACKGLDKDGGGSDATLICCGQFMACPRRPDGSCGDTPRVINNSWGGGSDDDFFNGVVEAWHAAGIFPVFSIGNDGPECRTAHSPADFRNVIAVGASNSSNGMASFSSKGPSNADKYLVKPDISAPGVGILSTWLDNSYFVGSGTSAAAPYVSGVVALLISRNPKLKYNKIVSFLTHYTNKKVTPTGYDCGGVSENNHPNFASGYGIVNATASLQAVIKDPKLSK